MLKNIHQWLLIRSSGAENPTAWLQVVVFATWQHIFRRHAKRQLERRQGTRVWLSEERWRRLCHKPLSAIATSVSFHIVTTIAMDVGG
jgi:nitroimidazol reductase NimA-like FMN-containing flavoprotein (pyridoxamine 5'-phosphate oxidase superfamily)